MRSLTGCDLQRVDDVTDAVRSFGARYLDRVYTAQEQADCRTGDTVRPASLAARFAAKEAVLKLIGTADGVDPRSVEVTTAHGRPVVHLHGRAARLAADAGLGPVDVSLSHTGDLALATASALADEPTSRPTTTLTTSLTTEPTTEPRTPTA